ncbi:MAG TPA: DUF4342 domain-containing protein [bacterium]|nr:DUF4342 domain-containing protein [bacterium]
MVEESKKKPAAKTAKPEAKERLCCAGEKVLAKGKEAVQEGNKRRVVISHDGKQVIQLPLTIAVIASILAPYLAVLGLIVGLATGCSIAVEKDA